jgi:hypothetical protein
MDLYKWVQWHFMVLLVNNTLLMNVVSTMTTEG